MSDQGLVSSNAAEVYDELFLPAIFAEWAPRLVAAAKLAPGQRVVDVACGTGVLTLAAAQAVSPGGAVVGVDLNPGMLAVAGRKPAAIAIDWREGRAEALPCEAGAFDAALCQFGLMFFADRTAALREMARVLRPGGRLAVAVWSALERTPGYTAATRLIARLFGDAVADRLRAPYALGAPDSLATLLADAGLHDAEMREVAGEARFPSLREWLRADVRGWTLDDAIDDDGFERLVATAERELSGLTTRDGAVRFAHPAILATARTR